MIEICLVAAVIAYVGYTLDYFLHNGNKWDDVLIYIAITLSTVIALATAFNA